MTKEPKLKKCLCGGFFDRHKGVEHRAVVRSIMKQNQVCSEECLPFARAQFESGTRFWQVKYFKKKTKI